MSTDELSIDAKSLGRDLSMIWKVIAMIGTVVVVVGGFAVTIITWGSKLGETDISLALKLDNAVAVISLKIDAVLDLVKANERRIDSVERRQDRVERRLEGREPPPTLRPR